MSSGTQRTDPRVGRAPIAPTPHGDRLRWSVMIPTFECDDFLAATLESVLAQLEPGMQVEVVDDCSATGDPAAIVREIGRGRVDFFRQPVNVGHTRNFNTCLRRARGEIVHLLHGDDLVAEGFYRRMGAHLDTWHDAGAAICRHAIIDEHSVQQSLGPLLQTTPGPLQGWLRTIASGQVVQPPSVVVRRSVYEAIGGFNEGVARYGEDWEMWVRVAAATTVVYEPEALAAYRKRTTGSLSDHRHVARNMSDMRFVMRANRLTLEAAGERDADAIVRTARRSLSEALLRRARRLASGPAPKVPFAMAAEAVHAHPTPRIAGRSALVVGRGLLARAAIGRIRPPHRRRRSSPASPLATLVDAPPAVRAALGSAAVRGLRPSPPPKLHLMYAIADDRVLHVYGPPSDRVRRSLADRVSIEQLGVGGMPSLHVAEEVDERVWLIEQRLPGRAPLPEDVDSWFPEVANLLVALAGPPGPPLHETAFWAAHASPAAAAAARWRPEIERAWQLIADLPARALHGDAQPKNVLLDASSVGLVDWEGAWRHGLPGLDLVFLALMSGARTPDPTVLPALVADHDLPDRPLLAPLARVGVTSQHLRAASLAILSTLVLGELRRTSRAPQRRHQPTPFRALLDELAPVLADT